MSSLRTQRHDHLRPPCKSFAPPSLRTPVLYNQIQARGIDSFKASKAVQAFKSSVQEARNVFSAINVTSHGAITRPRYSEERSVVAKEICDVILSQNEERFSFAGHLEASQLFDSNCFNEYSKLLSNAEQMQTPSRISYIVCQTRFELL